MYTQVFNRRHGKTGHLFQGRFNAILVDRDSYLLEVCRYVELNPVRARLVSTVENWPWSSYRGHVGLADSPDWLDTAGIHAYLLGRDGGAAVEHCVAAVRYAELVASASDILLWENGLRQQIYLGDAEFVERMQALASPQRSQSSEVPRVQRSKPLSLQQWLSKCDSREEALYRAHVESGLSMSAMAEELDLSVSRVSRLVARGEEAKGKT
jgi:hypothetical protein